MFFSTNVVLAFAAFTSVIASPIAKRSDFSGQATWYTQDGTQGSCGDYKSDSDLIIAINEEQKTSDELFCGKSVKITNTDNGETVTAVVADTCPGCGWGDLDLSLAAFKKIGDLDTGVLPITWEFVSDDEE